MKACSSPSRGAGLGLLGGAQPTLGLGVLRLLLFLFLLLLPLVPQLSDF